MGGPLARTARTTRGKHGRLADEVVAGRGAAAHGASRCRSSETRASAPIPPPSGSRSLRPAFTPEGTVTAGNASQISDGAAAVVVIERRGGRAHAAWSRSPRSSPTACRPTGTHRCTRCRRWRCEKALKRAGLAVADLGLFEVNEAFAAVSLHTARMLGRRRGAGERERRRGRAGPSDRRERRAHRADAGDGDARGAGVTLGAAAICGGGGQGDALDPASPVATAGRSHSSAVDSRCSSCTHRPSRRAATQRRPCGSSTTTLTSRVAARGRRRIADARRRRAGTP